MVSGLWLGIIISSLIALALNIRLYLLCDFSEIFAASQLRMQLDAVDENCTA